MRTHRGLVMLLVIGILSLSATYCAAIVVQRHVPMLLPGVDAQGNLNDFELAGPGTGLAVQFPRLGLIVQISRGNVTNETRRLAIFRDTGSIVFRPATGDITTATGDRYLVTRHGAARLIAVVRE